MRAPDPDEVLRFWFGESADEATVHQEQGARWWKKDPAFDAEIEERFGGWVRAAIDGELGEWTDTPRGTLALIILLDQFTRNIGRGGPEMYAGDERALALSEALVAGGGAAKLRSVERAFALMPQMHAEDVAVQDRCVERFAELAEVAPEGLPRERAQAYHGYAIQHRDIVARFGRFPHRNELLGRESTAEERAFLTEPGSKF